jgi:hypothetical protein
MDTLWWGFLRVLYVILGGMIPGLFTYGVISLFRILVLWIISGTFQIGWVWDQIQHPPGWLFRLSLVLGVLLSPVGLGLFSTEFVRVKWDWDSLTEEEREVRIRREWKWGCLLLVFSMGFGVLLLILDEILS